MYKGVPVPTVDMEECATRLVTWINQNEANGVVWYAHNAKGCDSKQLCRMFGNVSMEKELRSSIVGFVDTLPLFGALYPGQSYTFVKRLLVFHILPTTLWKMRKLSGISYYKQEFQIPIC